MFLYQVTPPSRSSSSSLLLPPGRRSSSSSSSSLLLSHDTGPLSPLPPREGMTTQTTTSTIMSRTIQRELLVTAKVRTEYKDLTSPSLQIKAPKQAEAVHRVEIRKLRQQLTALPEEVLENARRNYLLEQNNLQKNLQDFQMEVLIRIESVLKENMVNRQEDIRKYQLGGHDKATYERFFRIEPMETMSKAQFITGMRSTFGDELRHFDSLLGKLYDSFDLRRTDAVDWRIFLFLLSTLMLPHLIAEESMRVGFALYCSVGSFDLACGDPVSLGQLKRMICAPLLLSYHGSICRAFDDGFQQLLASDTSVLQYVAKKQAKAYMIGDKDPDDLKIPFAFFKKILTVTKFAQYMELGLPYGKKDMRMWTCRLEEEYYHPLLLNRIKMIRRYRRNEDCCNAFIAACHLRRKKAVLQVWIAYRERRYFFRLVLISAELRATIANYSVFIDHWRKVSLEYRYSVTIQRVVRGFIARRRAAFIRRLTHKVTLIQKSSRQAMVKWKVGRRKQHLYWAALIIQRVIRGRAARKRIATMIEEKYDREKKALIKRREEWMQNRFRRAAIAIQLIIRKFIRRRRTMKKMAEIAKAEEIKHAMELHLRELKLQDDLYKKEVSQWYRNRKIQHDLEVFQESQTREQKKLIIKHRQVKILQEKEQKLKERIARDIKLEEERIELWIKNWEKKIHQRGEARRKYCKNCLALPEDPEQVQYKKELQKKIKDNIKDVLRRADQMRIPMEIPEAQIKSTEEIIELEVQLELTKAREEMKLEGERLELAKIEKAKQQQEAEEMEKKRKGKWAILILQSYFRMFLAKRQARRLIQKRYCKHFDINYHEYFYEDCYQNISSWDKPKLLGNYDIEMENYWVILHARPGDDKQREGLATTATTAGGGGGAVIDEYHDGYNRELFYYYNPSTWEQRWKQPRGTILCGICQSQFAKAYLHYDGLAYCDNCLSKKCNQLILEEHYDTHDIYFTPFHGEREDATRLSLYDIPSNNWFTYSANIDHTIKMTEYEEVKHEVKEKQRRLSNLSIKNDILMCFLCHTMAAEKHCEDCDTFYCHACCKTEHKSRLKKYHFIVDLKTTHLPDIQNKEKKKKKKKKKKKHEHKKDKTNNKDKDKDNNQQQQFGDYGLTLPPIHEGIRPSSVPSSAEFSSEYDGSDGLGDSNAELSDYPPTDKPKERSDTLPPLPNLSNKATVQPTESEGVPRVEDDHHEDRSSKANDSEAESLPAPLSEMSEAAADSSTSPTKHRRKHKHKHKHKKSKSEGEESEADRPSSRSSEGEGEDQKKKKKKHKKRKKRRSEDGSHVTGDESEATEEEDSAAKAERRRRRAERKERERAQQLNEDGTVQPSGDDHSEGGHKKKHKKKKKRKDKNRVVGSDTEGGYSSVEENINNRPSTVESEIL